jgi:diguanylate cyclase (GGDEF)-like protein
MKLGPGEVRNILGVALPLSLTFVFLLKESPLRGSPGLLRALFILGPFAVLGGMFFLYQEAYLKIMEFNFYVLKDLIKFPHAALISIFIFGFTAFSLKDKKVNLFVEALFLAQLPVYFILALDAGPGAPKPLLGLCWTAVCGVLLHAMFTLYWQRVYLDELTGVPNRRALEEHLVHLPEKYVLAMIDIDHFKNFNDLYGHDQGDHVLRLVARHLAKELDNKAYRYGGEEFCALLPDSSMAEADRMAEKARARLERRIFHIRPSRENKAEAGEDAGKNSAARHQVKITVSMGLASPDKNHKTPLEVLSWADQALYQAKADGRNCVRVAS